MISLSQSRTQPISKLAVWSAFGKVKSKGGSAGVDGISIETIALRKMKYLYPIWNRLSSGSYYPQAVKQVPIPKIDGTKRLLGIPTVCDRVAQMVIREELEKIVEPQFHVSSFGYRPKRSAKQAVQQCKENCMKYSWVIDLDIKGFFDNIDHELLMKAVRYHTEEKHILMYVERFLKADIQLSDGSIQKNTHKGTPQGGVISPLLANIFMDIVFDKWMDKYYPNNPFERYADDVVIHCDNFKEALRLLEALKRRLYQCKLEAHRDKTKIVYCKRNQTKHPPFPVLYRCFDFLGFTFKTRRARGKWGHLQLVFTPSMSKKAIKRVGERLRELKIHRMVHLHIREVAKIVAPYIRGWINYYRHFNVTGLKRAMRMVNLRLITWVINKYRRFRRKPRKLAWNWLRDVYKNIPDMFVHWKHGFHP
jgi:group II intron reverse transcriptase/maturase